MSRKTLTIHYIGMRPFAILFGLFYALGGMAIGAGTIAFARPTWALNVGLGAVVGFLIGATVAIAILTFINFTLGLSGGLRITYSVSSDPSSAPRPHSNDPRLK